MDIFVWISIIDFFNNSFSLFNLSISLFNFCSISVKSFENRASFCFIVSSKFAILPFKVMFNLSNSDFDSFNSINSLFFLSISDSQVLTLLSNSWILSIDNFNCSFKDSISALASSNLGWNVLFFSINSSTLDINILIYSLFFLFSSDGFPSLFFASSLILLIKSFEELSIFKINFVNVWLNNFTKFSRLAFLLISNKFIWDSYLSFSSSYFFFSSSYCFFSSSYCFFSSSFFFTWIFNFSFSTSSILFFPILSSILSWMLFL